MSLRGNLAEVVVSVSVCFVSKLVCVCVPVDLRGQFKTLDALAQWCVYDDSLIACNTPEFCCYTLVVFQTSTKILAKLNFLKTFYVSFSIFKTYARLALKVHILPYKKKVKVHFKNLMINLGA